MGPRDGGAVSFAFFVMEGQWVSFFLFRFLFMAEKVVFLFYLNDFYFLFFSFFHGVDLMFCIGGESGIFHRHVDIWIDK